MAINQVINGKNRITEFPNRWSLTNVGGNNYDVEQVTGEITEVGTPYGKSVLDKIDNVLSYLIPNVDKTQEIIEKTYTGKIQPIDIYPTWANTTTIGYEITQNLTLFNGLSPQIKYKSNKQFRSSTTYSSDRICVSSTYSGSDINRSAEFLNCSKNDFYISDYYNKLHFYGSDDSYVEILFDLGIQCKPTFKYNVKIYELQSCKIQSSNDGVVWTDEHNMQDSVDIEFTPTNKKRYYRIYANNSSSSQNGILELYYLYINKVIFDELVNINKFTLDNNYDSFINNQRLLIEIPNTTDMTGVSLNTINDVVCDIVLQPNLKYELIYNENKNEFEIGGSKILYDITLEQAVNQVEFIGIVDKLQLNKVYALILYGTTTSNSMESIQFGNTTISSGYSSYINSPFIFSIVEKDSNLYIVGVNMNENESTRIKHPNLYGYEYIKCTTGINFNAGTRIIIKEVA